MVFRSPVAPGRGGNGKRQKFNSQRKAGEEQSNNNIIIVIVIIIIIIEESVARGDVLMVAGGCKKKSYRSFSPRTSQPQPRGAAPVSHSAPVATLTVSQNNIR